MTNKIVEICPICDSASFDPFLQCTDFTTSKETFSLKKCSRCSFIFTSPRPNDASLQEYYQSDKYISHTGKSYALFDSLYLFVRKFTLRWKTRLIKQYKQHLSILDYGCGTGEFLVVCGELAWKTFGVEPSDLAKSKAITLSKLNIKTKLSEFEGEKFDVITLWHVLEHIPDLQEKLIELREALNENGMLFVAVPNYQAYDATIYKEYWAAYDVPRHLWHFSKPTMQRLLTKTGFRLKEIKPMKLDAFYVSLLSQKYKSGWSKPSGLLKAFLTAFISNHKAKRTMNYSSLIYIATR